MVNMSGFKLPTPSQLKQLMDWFILTGVTGGATLEPQVLYNEDHDLWAIDGHVRMKRTSPDGRLPVKFYKITGSLSLNLCKLTSLEGCPSNLGGGLYVWQNELTTLKGAPKSLARLDVKRNQLQSLEGMPEEIINGIELTYDHQLPLLRCLNCTGEILLAHDATGPDSVTASIVRSVERILNKHRGTGKAGALKAAAELIRAGYKENARW